MRDFFDEPEETRNGDVKDADVRNVREGNERMCESWRADASWHKERMESEMNGRS